DGLHRLAGNPAYGDDAFHSARMRELREAGNDIADGIDAGLGSLHPFVHLDEAALRLDLGLLQTDVFRTRRPPDRDKNFFRFDGLALALAIGEGDFDAVFGLLDFLNLRTKLALDAALVERLQQLSGNFLILYRHQ